MTVQQLSATDAGFLYMETAETPMHVGGLYLYELPAGYQGDFYQNFRAYIASRMHLFPVFTRKLVQLPLDLAAPLWIKDDAIDLDYHIRHLTLPKPARFEDLEELVGQLHSEPLDRRRPLWQIYIIDGLADGRVAEFTKFHHAGFDGSAALAIVRGIYDTTPIPRPAPPAAADHKESLDAIDLIEFLYTSPLRQYLRTMQSAPDLLKAWARLALPDPDTLKLESLSLPPLAPWTRLNGSIEQQRACAGRTVSLKDIKYVAHVHEVTVNDVVLAACATALRRYLRRYHELPAEPLTAFVPMSVRDAGNVEMTIQTVGMLCSLATDIADPIKRLRAIHASSQNAKRLTDIVKPAVLGISVPAGASLLYYALMNLLGRYHLADNVRPLANLTVSNMIGSPVPLYLVGARLLADYPISIPTHGSALNITVQSYGDNLDIGVTACRRTVPDVRQLADDLVEAIEELKIRSLHPATVREAPAKKASGRATKRRKTKAAQEPAPASAPATAPGPAAEGASTTTAPSANGKPAAGSAAQPTSGTEPRNTDRPVARP